MGTLDVIAHSLISTLAEFNECWVELFMNRRLSTCFHFAIVQPPPNEIAADFDAMNLIGVAIHLDRPFYVCSKRFFVD